MEKDKALIPSPLERVGMRKMTPPAIPIRPPAKPIRPPATLILPPATLILPPASPIRPPANRNQATTKKLLQQQITNKKRDTKLVSLNYIVY
ncbi:hypothetical protein HY04_08770 [Kaistella antarctica]|uniref:Uncharacterized protein n=1 Tax=Kaistella antarctica TaxID=266748 RepID=A0ABR4TXA7_9FLAO|nr:hypothetical protein HY04_08770 [Kaistella antarctica]